MVDCEKCPISEECFIEREEDKKFCPLLLTVKVTVEELRTKIMKRIGAKE